MGTLPESRGPASCLSVALSRGCLFFSLLTTFLLLHTQGSVQNNIGTTKPHKPSKRTRINFSRHFIDSSTCDLSHIRNFTYHWKLYPICLSPPALPCRTRGSRILSRSHSQGSGRTGIQREVSEHSLGCSQQRSYFWPPRLSR